MMLDENTPLLVTANDVTTVTLDNATDAYVLTTGYLDANESVTYDLRLWMDYDTPAIDSVMNASFYSKVTVVASYATSLPTVYAAEHITSLYTADSTELAYDGTSDNNLRYIGASPDNYIDIGDNVLWRIIGIFEVDDGNGNTESRLKIIRSESIGTYARDDGVTSSNDWADSRLMMLLNDGYESETYGGSLYWNSESGTCYYYYNDYDGYYTGSCDFTSTGLTTTAQSYFADAVWTLGGTTNYSNTTYAITNDLYSSERGTRVYSGHATTWTGKIGLMYLSDYGYATGGGSTTDRDTCLSISLYSWYGYSDCYSNDWLYTSSNTWTLTVVYSSSGTAFSVYSGGYASQNGVGGILSVLPTGYLSSSVIITDGDGSEDNPFVVDAINYIKLSEQEDYGTTSTITAVIKNYEIGIVGYAFSTSDEEPSEYTTVSSVTDATYTYTATENGILYFYAIDSEGTVTQKSITVRKIDTTSPTAIMTTEQLSTGGLTVDASSSYDDYSGIATYYFSKDGGDTWYSSDTSSYTFTGLTSGETYTIAVKVKDKAGNVSVVVTSDIEVVSFATAMINCGGTAECFESNAYVISNYDISDLVIDDTDDENIRYIGADPNNYIDIGDNVLWRIIGVFEVDDGSGNTETRLKVVRSSSIGTYAWDNKASGTGTSTSNYGSNDWTDARLMMLLNDGYESETYGGSLYWNSESGTCYSGSSEGTKTCDFTETGLTTTAQSYFEEAIWTLGGYSSASLTASNWYTYERGTTVYSGHATTWTGTLALIYPSDYTYATSGGSTYNRDSCLALATSSSYWGSTYDDCRSNDWLYTNANTWTLTPRSSYAYQTFYLYSTGYMSYTYVYQSYNVYPTGYLSSSVNITSGDGSETTPFIASIS